MRNRVEITGVNTSELKTIANERMMELIVQSQNGNEEARDELVYGNLKLILSVIKKFSHRGENLDDLFQVGCLGLLKAIDNFDMSHGVRFSTYAVPMIIGEIRRYLRDNSSIRVSRSLKDLAYKSLHFKEQFLKENHREPSAEEIAKGLNVEEIDVVISLEAIQDPISIYTPIYNNGGDEIYLIDQIKDEDNSEDRKILELTIKNGMKRLSKREKNIINERYYLGKTQMEIANDIGISQAQVSRLEKNALKTIFDYKE
ncbi:MAG: RNA polymerase sporulation sigma factor SigG [Bacilli bacterium]|nr:RNA polymerase sporulation sigma factor SigG [Bacilli bacterium]MDD4076744.1 RNA polymerase sporulation sigma factor SigG [Bacilli bacterium]MDD4388797.1 RNA polymerase sporulation sigma factor SigG [Bacilli bacterium]